MTRLPSRVRVLLFGLAAIAAHLTTPASAATWWWDTTTTGLWTDGANWSDNATSGGTTGTVPTNNTTTDNVVFNQSSVNGDTIVQLNADRSIRGIVIANTESTALESDSATPRLLTLGADGIAVNAGAGAVTLGGGPDPLNLALSVTGSINNNSSSLLTVDSNVSRTASDTSNRRLWFGGTGNTVTNGVLSDGGVSGALEVFKSGTGTLTLAGANTFSGQANFSTLGSNGTVLIGVASVGAVGAITSSAFGTGTIALNGGGSVTIAGNDSVTARTILNPIVGTSLGGSITFGDGVHNASIDLAGGYTHAFTSGITNNLASSGTLTISGAVLLNDGSRSLTLNLAEAGRTIISGTISNGAGATGGISKTGGGSLALLAPNTYRGNTGFGGGGTLWLGASSVVESGTITSGPLGGGTLGLGGTGSGTTTISGNDSLNARTIANRVNLDFGVFHFGDGVNHGSLEFTGGIYNYWINKQVVNNLTGTSTLTFSGTFFTDSNNSGRTITFDGVGNTVVSGPIVNNVTGAAVAGAVTKTGSGTLTLSGTNLYSGATTVNGGAVVFAGDWAISGTAARPIVANAAGAVAAGYAIDQAFVEKVLNTSAGVVALAADSTNNLDFSSAAANMTAASLGAVGTATYSGVLTPNGTVYRLGGGGGTLTVSGELTGANTLSVGGPTTGLGGTVVLSSTASSYTGKTSVQNGMLQIAMLADTGAASALGAPTTTANGTIDIGSGTASAGLRYTGSGHATNRVINLAGTTGGATIEAAGSGAVVFSSAATATGDGAKTLTLTGTSTAANSFVSVVNNSGVNATSLTKAGSGRWILSGSSGYTGATTVREGVLALGVNGSFEGSPAIVVGDAGSTNAVLDLTAKTSSFSLGPGQTLSGGGTVRVASNEQFLVQGAFSPGNSPGLFTFDGGTTVLSGTTLMEIFGTSRATSPSHDIGFYDAVNIVGSGTLQFGGNLTLAFSSLFDTNTTFDLFTPASGSILTGNFTGVTVTGGFYTDLSWSQAGPVWKSSNTAGGQSLEFDASNGQLVIVPEPNAITLAGIGVGVAAWMARSRHRDRRVAR